MKEKLKINLKSNQGFTIQDLIVAIVVITLFAGLIGGMYVSIFRLQSETTLDAALTVYAIQILEYIDEIPFNQVMIGMEGQCRTALSLPSSMQLQIDVTQTQENLKNVKITLGYTFQGNHRELMMENSKVKES